MTSKEGKTTDGNTSPTCKKRMVLSINRKDQLLYFANAIDGVLSKVRVILGRFLFHRA